MPGCTANNSIRYWPHNTPLASSKLGPHSTRLVSDHVSESSEALLHEVELDERLIEELLEVASNRPLGRRPLQARHEAPASLGDLHHWPSSRGIRVAVTSRCGWRMPSGGSCRGAVVCSRMQWLRPGWPLRGSRHWGRSSSIVMWRSHFPLLLLKF